MVSLSEHLDGVRRALQDLLSSGRPIDPRELGRLLLALSWDGEGGRPAVN